MVQATPDFEPVYNPKLEISKVVESINIDGNLNENAWSNAVLASNFTERRPGESTLPAVKTEVFVTYDEEKLYVSFNCYDDPSSIRATMSQRDQYEGDDQVGIMLDTYGDASWAYQFWVNPYGVQKDLLWSAVGGDDYGFDLIWESAAQVTSEGYTVEIAIPFSSLRFPNEDVQSWKMDFGRSRPRESDYQYNWSAVDRNIDCWPCQWGTIDGINNVKSGKGVELLPTVIGYQSGQLSDINDPTSDFDNENVDGELSISGKYSISSDMLVEGAYNPDFSQIEADAAQIDVNSAFALFYPERRPYFQEGSDLFRTLFNSFYTRTINDPQVTGKITGRMGNNSFAFLTALDENTAYIIPFDQTSGFVFPGKSLVNVFRGLHTYGDNSQLGVMLSDRRFEDNGSNSVAAVDGDIRFTRTLSADFQFIATHTAEGTNSEVSGDFDGMTFDGGKKTAIFDEESFYGHAFITRLKRFGRSFVLLADYNQVSPTYRTQVGFDPLVNYRNASVFTGYNFYPQSGLVNQIRPQIYATKRWGFDGQMRSEGVNLETFGRLNYAQTQFTVGAYYYSENWRGKRFDNLWTGRIFTESQLSNALGVGLDVYYGGSFARFSTDTDGSLGVKSNETSIHAYFTIKPIDRLILEPDIDYIRNTDAVTGEEIFDGYIARTRVRYQANKELSLRLVVQYNDFSEQWDIDPLLTYRVSPFTVFYLGSTLDYRNYNVGPNDQNDLTLSSRQFFMKLQYSFQI
jgi:hypothetical protein